jgi:hypothetical protein
MLPVLAPADDRTSYLERLPADFGNSSDHLHRLAQIAMMADNLTPYRVALAYRLSPVVQRIGIR